MEMLQLHWPHWATQVIDDVEHQGELQIIGFVLIMSMLIGTLLFACVTLLVELLKAL